MRFFKPTLLKRLLSAKKAIARPAARQLDEQSDAYITHLKAIRPLMPNTMRAAMRGTPSLHDARLIRAEGWAGRPRVSLLLRLEGGRTLELRYRTATADARDSLETVRHDIAAHPDEGLFILHDEYDHDAKEMTFTHSILFGNGLELRIRMRDMAARLGESFEAIATARGQVSA